MMYDAIKNFAAQFAFEPVVENADKLGHYKGFIVAGMGGSHLAGDLLRVWKPKLDLTVHSDYGLPRRSPDDVGTKAGFPPQLFIATSYSGNTEETLDSFQEAIKRKMPVAVISVGGKLLELAKKESIPYVQIPDTGIQPRLALGFLMRALLKLMGEEQAFDDIGTLASALNPLAFENAGKELASRLAGRIPVVYASRRNFPKIGRAHV